MVELFLEVANAIKEIALYVAAVLSPVLVILEIKKAQLESKKTELEITELQRK